MSDPENIATLQELERAFCRAIARAHRQTRNPLVAGSLVRALNLMERVRLELEAAGQDVEREVGT